MFDYQKICQNLFKDLSPRTKDVLEGRLVWLVNKKRRWNQLGDTME